MPHAANAPDGAATPVPAKLRKCAECGMPFSAKREHSRFCDAPCRKAWNNRNTARGGPVMPLLQAWAETRHARSGSRAAEINRYARRELTAMAKAFAEEDAAAGRPTPLDYVGALMDSKAIYADRAR